MVFRNGHETPAIRDTQSQNHPLTLPSLLREGVESRITVGMQGFRGNG